MTTESERISLDEFDGLRRYLWNIEAQADHLAEAASRLSRAVDDLPKRPEFASKAECEIARAQVNLGVLQIVIQHAKTELDVIRARYKAKPPFV